MADIFNVTIHGILYRVSQFAQILLSSFLRTNQPPLKKALNSDAILLTNKSNIEHKLSAKEKQNCSA